MHQEIETNARLTSLVRDLNAGGLSRRQFMTAAAKLGISAPLAAAIIQASGLSGSAAPSNQGGIVDLSLQDNGKTLVVAIIQSTVQLDPAVAGSNGYGDIIPINENLYEGLTRYRVGTAELEPALAESWETSEDGLTYVFTIRSGVTFHDGTPLDAAAVATNYLRQIDPEHPLHREGMTYVEILFGDVESVEATGDLELTITLSRPIILLPAKLSLFAAGIASPTALEEYADNYSQHAAGTGPFRLESWTPDVELVYVANDDYWGGRPAIDRVIWRSIPDDTVRLAELTTGGVDIANQIDFKDVAAVENNPDLALVTGTFWNVQFLGFNQTLPPFDNPLVREALQYAINKENIAEVVFYGNYVLGAGPIAPGVPGYDESLADYYSFDPERAIALLEEAGATDLTFDLYNRGNSFWPLLGQLVLADLEAVGVTANLLTLEDAEFFGQLNASAAPAFLNDWTWDNGDPDNVMFSLYTAPRAITRLGYENPQVNELNTQAQVESDQDVRLELYAEAQQLITEDAINVILGYPSRAIATIANVENLVLSPIGNIVLRDVDLS
jgi:peptide/nickel transport system substrate-binding protein